MQLRSDEMPLMQQMVRDVCGVSLDDSKGYLIESRLSPIAERVGATNFNELYILLRHSQDRVLANAIVDAITTHETTWFRDGGPYDLLERDLLQKVVAARSAAGQPKRLRIWSAACSTGQEPYSIAMILAEKLPDVASWDIEILATDISAGTIAKAKRGVFSELDMSRTERPAWMRKYFQEQSDGYRVTASVQRLVRFRQRNLLLPFAAMGPFDIVFLRNVLIYFDPEPRRSIVERTAKVMQPHGYLIAGGSENLRDVGPQFLPEMISGVPVYQPNRILMRSPR